MKLSALLGQITKTFIEVPGDEDGGPPEKVEVHYRPGALTIEVSDRLREAANSGWDQDVVLVMLEPILVWWDLEDEIEVENEDGSISVETRNLGVTVEDIKKVPLNFLGLVLDQMNSESRPNPTMDETLEDGSPPEASQEESPAGTPSSKSPSTLGAPPGNSSSNQ